MSYSPQNIRNICLLGHGGNGKTTLVESFLYLTGGSDIRILITNGKAEIAEVKSNLLPLFTNKGSER